MKRVVAEEGKTASCHSNIPPLLSLSTNPDIPSSYRSPTQPVTTIKPSISKLAILLPQSQVHNSKALTTITHASTVTHKHCYSQSQVNIQRYFLTLLSLTSARSLKARSYVSFTLCVEIHVAYTNNLPSPPVSKY